MLLILLERPREVISRDELRSRLWSEETFGASDNRLNVVAAKLREALHDPANPATQIETIRGKGYVFVGDVIEELPPAKPALNEIPIEVPEPSSTTPESQSIRSTAMIWYAVLSALILLGAIGVLTHRWVTRPLISPQDKVAVGRFLNSTGEDTFEGLLEPALRLKLEESPYLGFVSSRDLRARLRNPNSPSLSEQLRACNALGAKVLIEGQIVLAESVYEVQLTTRRCSDGGLLATEFSRANSPSSILVALGTASLKLRGRLGEPASSLQRFNTPLSQATTASLAALKAFSNGEQKRFQGQETQAIFDYKLSIDLDPQFALAYARLGTIYDNLGEHLLSQQYYQKAFDLRDRTTDRERLYIASHYYSYATGEIERSIEAQELWRTLYPRDLAPAVNLAVEYLALGQSEKSVELAKTAEDLDNASDFAFSALAAAYLRSGNYAALTPLCSRSSVSGSNYAPMHSTCFLLAFVQGNQLAMNSEIGWARGNPAGSELIEEAAWTAMDEGQMKKAAALFSEAHDNALANGLREFAAQIDADRADMAADIGDHAQSRTYAIRALDRAPESTQVEAAAALALARIGDLPRAESESAKAAARSPKDTILRSAELAAVNAAVHLQQRNPGEAIDALKSASPFDLCSAMNLAPAYYRGLAYLEAKQLADAAREFQKVVDHSALAPNSIYIPLSYLQLSRALQLEGNRKYAAEAANRASLIWHYADQDFAPLHDLASEIRLSGKTPSQGAGTH